LFFVSNLQNKIYLLKKVPYCFGNFVKKSSNLFLSAIVSFPIGFLFLIIDIGRLSKMPVSIYYCLSSPACSQSFILKYRDLMDSLLFSYCVVTG